MATAIASVQCGWGNSSPMQIELDPGLASAHYHLGSLYTRAPTMQDLARQHLQRAADLDTHGYYRARAEMLLAGVQ